MQAGSHNAYFVRRLAQDVAGYVALWLGNNLNHEPFAQRLLQASCQWLPTYPEPHIALCRRLFDRGEAEIAWEYAQAGLNCASGRLAQPVLPLMIPNLLRRAGLTFSNAETLRRAISTALMVAEKTQTPEVIVALSELARAVQGHRATYAPQSGGVSIPPNTNHQNLRKLPLSANELLETVELFERQGDPVQARCYLKAHRHRFPTSEAVWAKATEYARMQPDAVDAQRCLQRTMILSRTPWVHIPWNTLRTTPSSAHEKGVRNDNAFPFLVKSAKNLLVVGETTEYELRCLESNDARPTIPIEVLVICPFGFGITATPRRGQFVDGTFRFEVTAHRSNQVNQNQPWELRILVTDGAQCTVQTTAISVTDRSEIQPFAVVTDDHELQDGRAETTIQEVRTTLIEKLAKCLDIADENGASWGICLEANSVRLLDWASCYGGAEWTKLAKQYRKLLTDAVHRGHDIGLHIHDFYDPESPHFAMSLSADNTKLRTSAAILFAPVSERPFWHRALFDARSNSVPPPFERTKLGSLRRQLALVESLGRLADPGFRVSLFRAGSYDVGTRPEHWQDSLFAVREAGILCDSNVTKGRLYHRFDRQTFGYCSEHNPGEFPTDLRKTALLEIFPEYNIEGDFLADRSVLNYYADKKLNHIRQLHPRVSGPTVLTSICHTKFINFRRGLSEYSLDDSRGDWQTIREHLGHLRTKNVPVIRIRDATDQLVDMLSPEPVLVRGDAVITACSATAETCHFVYPLVYLGKGIPLDRDLPLIAVVRPPAWCLENLVDFDIRDENGNDIPDAVKSHDEIVFWLTRRAHLELHITIPAHEGIQMHRRKNRKAVVLTSRKDYLRAHVRVDNIVYRNVHFFPDKNGVRAVIDHDQS